MVRRLETAFSTDDGLVLRAWLFLPDEPAPRPAITMANGFGGTRRYGMARFALAFAQAGFVVLLHDHRNFGDSDGAVRGEVDPWLQVDDWRCAISHLEARPEVDPTRLGLWGASFAGGHAIVLGASDRRLRAVVAQTPAITGAWSGLRGVVPDPSPALEAALADDDRARFHGKPPQRIPLITSDAAARADHSDPAARDFYAPDGATEQTITLRSTRAARLYEPGVFIDRVSPTPLLMVLAAADAIAPTAVGLAAYERAGEPKALVIVEGGHFASYKEQFPTAGQAATDWFVRRLG